MNNTSIEFKKAAVARYAGSRDVQARDGDIVVPNITHNAARDFARDMLHDKVIPENISGISVQNALFSFYGDEEQSAASAEARVAASAGGATTWIYRDKDYSGIGRWNVELVSFCGPRAGTNMRADIGHDTRTNTLSIDARQVNTAQLEMELASAAEGTVKAAFMAVVGAGADGKTAIAVAEDLDALAKIKVPSGASLLDNTAVSAFQEGIRATLEKTRSDLEAARVLQSFTPAEVNGIVQKLTGHPFAVMKV